MGWSLTALRRRLFWSRFLLLGHGVVDGAGRSAVGDADGGVLGVLGAAALDFVGVDR
ncbi:hypothetical protein [Streptomyces noursei]